MLHRAPRFSSRLFFSTACSSVAVFILCAYSLDVLYILCASETAGLLDGNHAFIAIDFAYMTTDVPAGRGCTLNNDLEGEQSWLEALIYIFVYNTINNIKAVDIY